MWRVPDAPRCCFFMPRQHAIRPVLLELGVNNISRPFIDCEEPDNYGAAQRWQASADFPAVRCDRNGLFSAAELHTVS